MCCIAFERTKTALSLPTPMAVSYSNVNTLQHAPLMILHVSTFRWHVINHHTVDNPLKGEKNLPRWIDRMLCPIIHKWQHNNQRSTTLLLPICQVRYPTGTVTNGLFTSTSELCAFVVHLAVYSLADVHVLRASAHLFIDLRKYRHQPPCGVRTSSSRFGFLHSGVLSL